MQMDEEYVPVSPLLVTYKAGAKFDLYLKHGNAYTLYAKHGKFTARHRELLHEKGLEYLYIKYEDKSGFESYLEDNFAPILSDPSLPVSERAKVLMEHCSALMQETFENKLPEKLSKEYLRRVKRAVRHGRIFLTSAPKAFETVGKLISHTYHTFSHCVNVFVYATLILDGLNVNPKIQEQAGLGAMLHDVGKIKVGNHILNKPGRLSPDEFEEIKSHPARGAALCQELNLSNVALNCVLFHHEKLDGSGYPSGMDDLPDYVKAVSLADIYDALTSKRPYGKVYSPFEAFKVIVAEVDKGKLDRDMCAFFIKRLSQGVVEI